MADIFSFLPLDYLMVINDEDRGANINFVNIIRVNFMLKKLTICSV